MRIKLEMNTFERSPAQPPVTVPLAVVDPRFRGSADVASVDRPAVTRWSQQIRGTRKFRLQTCTDNVQKHPICPDQKVYIGTQRHASKTPVIHS